MARPWPWIFHFELGIKISIIHIIMSSSSSSSSVSSPAPAAPLSVRAKLFQDEKSATRFYNEALRVNCQTGVGEFKCSISGRAPRDSGKDVRPVMKVFGQSVSLHVLAMVMNRIEGGLRDWDDSLHVSHLCHTPKCIRRDHLVLETPEVNNARNLCARIGCGVCNTTMTNCSHNPLCMLRRQQATSCSCSAGSSSSSNIDIIEID
jgi:hypothetical protein